MSAGTPPPIIRTATHAHNHASTLALMVALGGLLGTAGPLAAAEPSRVSFGIESTRVLAPADTGCDFLIVRHASGTYHITTFYDAGNVTRTQDYVSAFSITDTNPVSGKALTSRLAGPVIITPNRDGTVTVAIPGNDGHYTDTGGVVWSNAGLVIYTASADDPFTPLEVVAVHGLYTDGTDLDGPYPESCSALA